MSTIHPSGTPAPAKATPKARGPSKKLIVTLLLPASILTRFPAVETPNRKASRPKQAATPPRIPTANPIGSENQDASSEQLGIPSLKQENEGDEPNSPVAGAKRKDLGPKSGTKRSASTTGGIEGMPKPRGRPGPKKKPRLDGEPSAPGMRSSFGGSTPMSTHKLGPKANQGAINAGLRALDRTGKPCRRWTRKAFEVKSFTGVVWGLPSWRAPVKPTTDFDGDVKSDTSGSTVAKGELPGSSAVQSERGYNGKANSRPALPDVASSPAPAFLAETPIST